MDNLIEDQRMIQHEIHNEMKKFLHRLRYERLSWEGPFRMCVTA